MEKIYLNGELVNRDETHIDIEDRGFQFGDGVYDVVGIYNGNLFLMEEHLQRLQRSARELAMELTFSLDQLKEALVRLVEKNGVKEGVLYIQVTRGVAPRAHEFPDEHTALTVIAYTSPLGELSQLLSHVQENGAGAILHEDIRWLRCDIKTVNLIPNIMAKQKASEVGAVDAILHRDDIITEASSANVFIVRDQTVYTHPADHLILNGITRQKVIQICNELQIDVKEEPFTVTELLEAEELFITATKLDVIPIITVDDTTIGKGTPGDVTRSISRAMKKLTDRIQQTSI